MNNSSKEVLKINKLNAIYPNTTNYVLKGLNLNINRGDRAVQDVVKVLLLRL